MAGRDRRQRTEIGNDESKEGIRGVSNEMHERRPAEKRDIEWAEEKLKDMETEGSKKHK
jgi:hypothetical protein